MRPFLFLGTRAEDDAADGEYAAVLRFTGLDERDLHRRRVERDPLPDLDLAAYSGLVLGGGPFNVSDPEDAKPPVQRRVEADLRRLAERVLAEDVPFLGCCYGIGTLGVLRGGRVDGAFGEPIGAATVDLTGEGRDDPLFGVLPDRFDAFLGHKEAVSRMPAGAVLLATGTACPVQAFRLGRRVYATQFHPELDAEQLALRMDVYRHHGYFEAHEYEVLVAAARAAEVSEPPRILSRFVELFAR